MYPTIEARPTCGEITLPNFDDFTSSFKEQMGSSEMDFDAFLDSSLVDCGLFDFIDLIEPDGNSDPTYLDECWKDFAIKYLNPLSSDHEIQHDLPFTKNFDSELSTIVSTIRSNSEFQLISIFFSDQRT